MKKLFSVLLMLILVQLPARAQAVSLELFCGDGTALTCDGINDYTLRGGGFTNIGGVQIEIQYDSTARKSPQVTKGALLPATATINPNVNSNDSPSSIIIAAGSATSPSNGTGTLATIKFTPASATVGNVSIAKYKLTDLAGVKIQQVNVMNPADFNAKAQREAAAQTDSAADDAKLLTVASSNPAGGVWMTISPKDNSGNGSGSTQLVRIYSNGASVTL